ncbi:MAG TPA: ROK family protein [Frankiaceae bacterium]|nr:ROK family protein [Frankiaceae bacterium]
MTGPTVVVGLDQGGSVINATVFGGGGTFLLGELVETPSLVLDGPEPAMTALVDAFDAVLARIGIARSAVRAVGLDTPGPASADGRISSLGSTNFGHDGWRGYDIRGALEDLIGLPVTYANDGNAAALYAHQMHFGALGPERSSMSAIVGTGLGGGLVQDGRVISGAAGMAGEVGHVHIPMLGLLADGQPLPRCNCGLSGDAESIASLTGIRRNLLPFWLERFPDHPLHALEPGEAAKQVRTYAEQGDAMALAIFAQQAQAIGALFTIVSNLTDPHGFFLGGGVVEAAPHFRDWFLRRVQEATRLRAEQESVVTFALVPDRDMAGARGAALAAAGAHAARARPTVQEQRSQSVMPE